MNRILKDLKWIAAGSGTFIPAFSYFTTYVPPLFPEIGIIIGAISGAILFSVLQNVNIKKLKFSLSPSIIICISIVLIVAYSVSLNYLTVIEPSKYKSRFQIGFGKFDWSLTEIGLSWKSSFPNETIENWMLNEAAFRPRGPEIIWKAWTIYIAGIYLIILYFLGFVFWTYGFCLLVKKNNKTYNVTY